MATKDRRKLQHIHSSIADKQPTPQSLEVGEIAVNNSADKEFLSLKNSNDKVVRFSSDSTLIDWIENKEVVPYKGYVRGETGPSATSGETPSADAHGSYGITNNDLLANKSNLIFKINQVAAKKTVKYDKINAAKDLYNKDINPSENTPTGKTDGAGFFIDMSRYAMIGANPSFSSITVTDKSDLSGNTTIANGDGTGTRTGHTLAIKTTDVTANDTNWTETITNRTSTVTNETDKITTLNESATTRTTVVGTENLTVSGTTTEIHTGNVGITNSANVTATTNGTTTETKVGNVVENHSGTTIENKKGVVTENNLSAKTENTTGALTENNSSNHVVNTTGTTNITRTGVVTEDNKNNVTRTTSGTTTETFKGQVTENNQSGYTVNTTGNVIVNTTGTTTEVKVGNVAENHSGTTTENKRGVVTENNLSDKTENTTGAHSIYSTGNTCINSQANANFYGKVNTNIGVACDGTTKGSATTVVGTTTLNMSGATTTISGNTTNVTGATTLNLSGNTTNKRALTANTTSTSAYTSATTATTIIGTANTSATTATLSGNTLDITEATRLSAKTPSAYVSGTNLSVVETNTDIESCGRISGKTNEFTIQECATGSGKTVINQTDIKASGKTLSFDETTSISAKTPTTTLSGTGLTITETTSTINSTNTNLTGTNLTINEANTVISSCTKFDIISDDLSFNSCTTAGTIDFNFCNGFGVNSNNITLQQCNTAGTINILSRTQNISGTTLDIKEAGDASITTTGSTNISATQSICETAGVTAAFVGATTTNIGSNCSGGGNTAALNVRGVATNISAGTLTETVTGATNETHTGTVTINNGSTKTETTTGAVTENNKAGYTVNTTGDTCLQSTADVNVGGAANTNIGTNCDDSVKTNYVNIKAKSGITETANTVTISGTASTNISGGTVNLSGASVNVSGATFLNLSGATTNVSGTTLLNLSGATVNESGTTNNNKFTTINTTATTINNNVTNLNVTGTTKLSGDVTVGGSLTIPIPCSGAEGITSTTVNNALCELFSRGKVTMTKTTPAATSEILATYKLFQDGSQIGEDINIPKDHLLKDVSIVYGKASGSSFTACTSTASDCHWYIKLVWNVFDPQTGHADDKTTYLLADDFIKDIDDKNPTGVTADSYNNIAVNVEYDGKKNVVSATTTPTIHASQNIYADGAVSGATVSGTNVSAGTLTVTGNTTLKATTATSISASTEVKSPSISGTGISATTFYGSISKKLTWAAGAFTADTTGYNGSADKTITVPTAISHLATRGKLTVTHNGLTDTYDPASDKSMTLPHSALSFSYGSVSAKTGSDSYNTSAAKSITIPTSIDDLKNYNGTCVEIPHNVCVTGTITSSGAIYSSDRNLKENIMNVSREEINKASNVLAKSFNFKSDESKRKVYGVIAQDVQEVGLNELVHTDENGNLGVDYTSLLLLKIAYLEDLCGQMYGKILKLEDKLNDK